MLSTGAVSLAAKWSAASGLGQVAVTMISQAANLSTFGALWALQYVLLDTVLFGRHSRCQDGAGADVNDLAEHVLIELEDAA